uniref:Putative secreted protein n=1 Tax=Anopheles triannulatus TaxID=58253 RepID=A0A2M4B2H6_9DIPT
MFWADAGPPGVLAAVCVSVSCGTPSADSELRLVARGRISTSDVSKNLRSRCGVARGDAGVKMARNEVR